jgi:hypothetical protein
MAKNKSINFIIPLVIYPFDILVSVAEPDEVFAKTIVKHLPSSCLRDLEDDNSILRLGETTQGRCVNLPTGHQTIIRIKKYPTSCRDYGILSHEIFHAVSFILWRMDIPLEIGKTDEVYAYLIDYVTTEVYKKV